MIESMYVITLFFLFSALWEVKRRGQKKMTGIDPDVFPRATTPLQRYMNGMNIFMTMLIITLIALHAGGVHYHSVLSRFGALNSVIWNHLGFTMGLAGLGLCFYSQTVMGASWRVGIDETQPASLITAGIYSRIRNPTYLGLFMLVSGVWLIWPTWSIGIFALLFVFFLEVQVRCEEEYLLRCHGSVYEDYMARTKRYIPGIY